MPGLEASAAASLPAVSLPKGGGAIQGIGEKFATQPATGTGSMSVPLALSPGRSGFGPQLSLGYDSGSGNGPFGFGWSLDLPRIERKTSLGLPRYQEAPGVGGEAPGFVDPVFDDPASSQRSAVVSEAEGPDVFLLSGAEDLVPVLGEDGRPWVDTERVPGTTIHRFRPRIEGLFARIERWSRADGEVHWRSISRDNVLTIYGRDRASRIADPEAPERVFAWLISETRDDRGNGAVYDYKAEDAAGVDLSRAHQGNRGGAEDPRRGANRYLKSIRYGNRVSLLDPATGRRPDLLAPDRIAGADWMFQGVFDYGEHDRDAPTPAEIAPWDHRPDPFSSYRAGFEVRTCRLCRRVLMFHHFPDEPGVGADCLVRSTDLTHSSEGPEDPENPEDPRHPVYSFLTAVHQRGHVRLGAGGYRSRSLPPVELAYSRPEIRDRVEEVDAESLENLPMGVDGAVYRWIDLHGEGVPGVLTEQGQGPGPGGQGWYYKRNLGPAGDRPRLAPLEPVAVRPNQSLAGARWLDLAGDGRADLAVLDGPTPGFYEHDGEEGWEPFRSFESHLRLDLEDPNLRFLDLDGNGRADVLLTEDEAFVWYPSRGEAGFGPARRVPRPLDEERGPRLVFAEEIQTIHLADLSGDGLVDLVRIRSGEVCYWPNLGHGRFGAKVTMDDAPRFDHPDQFDPGRLRLADLDGSGTTDLVYWHADGVDLYFNQSGNGWSAARPLAVVPEIGSGDHLEVTDLLGNGTACLVWSSPRPDGRARMRYVDLMGGVKPHLLVRTANGLGAETRVTYAPSTRFYLQDRQEGRPWITRLPFPVQVVERVETLDHLSGNRFVSRYTYHHGYFDGAEREFRGFGRVDQWDTERWDGALRPAAEGEAPDASSLPVPPVLTRTWFHTGIHRGRGRVSRHFAGLTDDRDRGEYYREPAWRDDDAEAARRLLPDTVLPEGLSAAEEREACRALKGSTLRQEVYALDGSDREEHPYTVTEASFAVRLLQRRAGNRHGVFLLHPREELVYHYDREPTDPRTRRSLTLEVNDHGQVLRQLTIGYGRRSPSPDPALTAEDRARQTRPLLTYAETSMTGPVETPGDYRAPLTAEARTYELTGFAPAPGELRLPFELWTRDGFAALDRAEEVPYEEDPQGGPGARKRLVEHLRTVYRRDDLTGLLPLGALEPRALPGETYRLALTPGLVQEVFRRGAVGAAGEALLPDPGPLLEGRGGDQGGYAALDGAWWIPSGRVFFSEAADPDDPAATAADELAAALERFFLPHQATDPFGQAQTMAHDGHRLLAVESRDALGNRTTLRNDYRTLEPRQLTDPNRNRSAVAFDALGMVVATAVMGKEGEDLGDLLEGFEADLPLADLQAFWADPRGRAAALLGSATTRIAYDVDRFRRTGQPPCAAVLARESHVHEPGGDAPRVQIDLVFSDGFGREMQRKGRAAPGEAPRRGAPVVSASGDLSPGELVRDGDGRPVPGLTDRRWITSGRTVYDNKGRPVRRYEPFFSATPLFEPEREVTDTGVSPVTFYDPLGRVVATLAPDHTYEKVVYGPWRQTRWDGCDTVAPRPGPAPDPALDPALGEVTGDPRTDPHIGGFVGPYLDALAARDDGWQTWFERRIGGDLGPAEQEAARGAALHAGTPTTLHLDTLGRPFLTHDRNRFERDGAEVSEDLVRRVELDIEGLERSVSDPEGRVVLRCRYDLSGRRLHQASMEAGERWMLGDAAGQPIRVWDSRGFRRRTEHDPLRRPTGLFVAEGGGAERLAERTVYGEARGDGANHRTRVLQVFDGAGVVTFEAYDFRGRPLHSRRQLLEDFRARVDWSPGGGPGPALERQSFESRTAYDALDRPTASTTPDGSVQGSTFDEAGLLEGVTVRLRGAPAPTPFVTGIDYDARGQRTRIAYGNGAVTTYAYDPETFRLRRLRTTRQPPPGPPGGPDGPAAALFEDLGTVQDLRYTHDPVGNAVRIDNGALRTVAHGGQEIAPLSRFTYDALYRLVEARGREHIGQNGFAPPVPAGDHRDYPFVGHAHPNDLQALRTYTRRYAYDRADNLRSLRHSAAGGAWTRTYHYEEESPLEAGAVSNRLSRTRIGNGVAADEPYGHDAHGNLTAMPHLAALVWGFQDELAEVDLGGGGRAHYAYDASGRRVRKVVELGGGGRQERIYLAGFEVYRERGPGGAVRRERETLQVLDDRNRIALVETLTRAAGAPVAEPAPLLRYQLPDHLGSAAVELDGAGALISHEEYHPYGTTAFQAGRSAAEVAAKRYRYTAKERDEETGFTDHGARLYAPWLGRWTRCDPSGIRAGLNLYEYGHSNPVRFFDDDGRDPTADQVRFRAIFDEQLQADALSSHASTLIRAFRDDQISGGSARGRYESIVRLAGGNPNAPSATFDEHTIRGIGTEIQGPWQARGDWGFRRELQDSIHYHTDAQGGDIEMHRLSSNQIGHFLTATTFGYALTERQNYLAEQARQAEAYRQQHPYLSVIRELVTTQVQADLSVQFAFEETQYLRAMIGHELIGDRTLDDAGVFSTVASPFMTSNQDIRNFQAGRLDLIAIDDSLRGNSYQDLLLTWVGYRFGEHMANGVFQSREDAARWLELMLTDQDLGAVPTTDPFYQDAQAMSGMLQQFRDIQRRIHPNTAQPAAPATTP